MLKKLVSLVKLFAQLWVQIYLCIFSLKKEHKTFPRVLRGSISEHPSFNLLDPLIGHICPHLSMTMGISSSRWLTPCSLFWSLRGDSAWIWENGHPFLLFCRMRKSGESWISLPCRNHLTCRGGAPRTLHSRTTTWPSVAAMLCSSWNSRRTLPISLWCVLTQSHNRE